MARAMDKMERNEARHLLQVLSEQARSVRNAMDPQHGMHTVTDEAWAAQWIALCRDLDYFTLKVTGEK